MTSSPGFDLNDPTAAPGPGKKIRKPGLPDSKRKRRSIICRKMSGGTVLFPTHNEPGSTFIKALTAAMAMEEGKFLEKMKS